MLSQLKTIYTTEVLSVICGWRALAVAWGGTKSQGRGGWAGGCPQQQVHIPGRLVISPALANRANSLSNAAGL